MLQSWKLKRLVCPAGRLPPLGIFGLFSPGHQVKPSNRQITLKKPPNCQPAPNLNSAFISLPIHSVAKGFGMLARFSNTCACVPRTSNPVILTAVILNIYRSSCQDPDPLSKRLQFPEKGFLAPFIHHVHHPPLHRLTNLISFDC